MPEFNPFEGFRNMSTSINNLDIINAMNAMKSFSRMTPAPRSNAVKSFFNTLGNAATSALAGAAGGASSLGEYSDLINMQIQMQQEMMTVTMVSNIEKSQHETRMAPVRNIRVS